MSKKSLFRDVIAKMTEAVTMDEDNNLQVIDKVAMAEADEHFNRLMVEQASEWWAQLESAEDALADMSDQISFSELNADPSHLSSPQLAIDEPTEPSIDGMMESAEFNLSSIFEELNDDTGPIDGDDEYDKLITGNDDEGIGSDIEGTEFEDEMDDDLDIIGGDDEGEEDMLSDDGVDFDFSFLDDAGDEGEEIAAPDEGFTESDDDDDDDEDDDIKESDDDDDDEDEDEEDCD